MTDTTTGYSEKHVDQSQVCKIPQMDLWDPHIKHLIGRPPAFKCHQNYPPPLTYIYNDSVVMVNETAAVLYYPNDTLTDCYVEFFKRYV